MKTIGGPFLAAAAALLTLVAPLVSAQQPEKAREQHPGAAASANTVTKTDVNSADEKDLERLPGVGPATAKKMFAGRPYSSVEDLSRAGVSKRVIDRITPLVTVNPPAGSGSSRSQQAAPAQQRGS